MSIAGVWGGSKEQRARDALASLGRLAYADAFAVATAMAHGAQLLTGDPEILDGDPDWLIVDLRR